MGIEGGGIPVFDGKGYEIWRKKMMTLFISQGLWDLVQQGYQEMTTEDIKKDCKALYLIQQGVSDSIFPVIMKSNTSKEAWETIRDRFHDHQPPQQPQINEIDEEIMAATTIHIGKMISNLSPIYPETSIFRVPDALRLGSEEFYEPTVLSIGPYHHGKPRLASMEEHKVRYLQQLLQRMGMQSMDLFVRAVKPHEERVRRCYEESIESVSSVDLIQMLVLDGCFIIELLRRMEDRRDQHYRWLKLRENILFGLLSESHEDDKDEDHDHDDPKAVRMSSNELINHDPVIKSDVLLNGLQNDLLLLENQIPFFIIKILYDVIQKSHQYPCIKKLKTLILAFMCRKYLTYELVPKDIIKSLNVQDMSHILGIAHKTICPPIKKHYEVRNLEEATLLSIKNETFCFANSATKLEEANVRLMSIKHLIEGNIFEIRFEKGKLMIPSFHIDYHFEVDIRNFIALELCQQDRQTRYFCDYVVFMDRLIASTNDVDLLIRRGIITNQMIDAKFVDNMFKRLTRNIETSDPYTYYQISTDLNKYCDKRLNKWCASLKHKYFKSPWTFISILAASMLLTFTFTQTVYSIVSYYK